MTWHEFTFSEKKTHKLSRHLVFWLVWGLYFFVFQYILPQPPSSLHVSPHQSNTIAETGFLKLYSQIILTLLILFIQMLACYAFIYFLLPRYLLKARYLLFVAGILLLGIAMIQASQSISTEAMPFIQTEILNIPHAAIKKPTFWASISYGGIGGIKIIAAAAAIKLGKRWLHIQKEKERFEREKIEAELQLLKGQIHPGFLFNTLNNIYSFSLEASPRAPEMLLKLSDILSYMLYECNDREVPLEKEIKMLADYMTLEKMRYGDKLEMNMQMNGDTTHDKIAPLLLLSFIENSFRQSNSQTTEQAWINLEMQIEDHVLEMKLMNGKPLKNIDWEDGEENGLAKVERRLQLLYPGKHVFKIREEPEIMIAALQIKLKSLVEKIEPSPYDITTIEAPGILSENIRVPIEPN